MTAYIAALTGSTSLTRVSPAVIRLALDSLDADYTAVTGALTIQSTTDATHDSTIKLIIAEDPGARTGSLAPIARANLGVGVFCDEYVGWADYQKRGWPLIGQGPYANNFWHIRPRVTYADGTGVATRVTAYGDANGKTYRDAFAGPEDWNNNKGTITGTPAAQLYVEHILRWEDQQLDGPIAGHGVIDMSDWDGTEEVPVRLCYEHPRIEVNGHVFDHAVTYGGLVLEDAEQSWSQGIVSMAYTATTALVATDKGKAIVMTTDGDTGTILDYTATTVWIATDGTAGNSFDNSPTAGGAFTITGGTGAGTQDSAATSVANLWWHPTRPNEESGQTGNWLRDAGAHFGNAVDVSGYETFTELDGAGNTLTETVCTAFGFGAKVVNTGTIADCIATEDSKYVVGAESDPIVVHIVNGEDPTHRVMNSNFGASYSLSATQQHIAISGERSRMGGHNQGLYPLTGYTLTDFSRVMAGKRGRAFFIQAESFTADHTDYLIDGGFIGEYGNGFYPNAKQSSQFTFENVAMRHVVARNIGGTNHVDSDAHVFGFQGASRNLTLEYFIFIDCGGPVQFYQNEGWLANPSEHQWGNIRVRFGHIDGTPAGYSTALTNNVGIHFGGDPDDDASEGSGAANPPTNATSFDVEVTAVRVLDKGESFRTKWRDRPVRIRNCYSDSSLRAEYEIAGADPDDSRSGQFDIDGCEVGPNFVTAIYDINVGSGYQIIADNNTFNVLASATVFNNNNFADWQALVRLGDTYDPNSTRVNP